MLNSTYLIINSYFINNYVGINGGAIYSLNSLILSKINNS